MASTNRRVSNSSIRAWMVIATICLFTLNLIGMITIIIVIQSVPLAGHCIP